MSTYTLIKTETGKKAAKYLYQVKDEQGNIISSRESNREYVACYTEGSMYFGRLDLLYNHPSYKYLISNGITPQVAFLKNN